MPLVSYICFGIATAIAALFLIFALMQIVSKIVSSLNDIHLDLCHIHGVMVRLQTTEEGGNPIILFNEKPTKKREYWRDENGKRHWRKNA